MATSSNKLDEKNEAEKKTSMRVAVTPKTSNFEAGEAMLDVEFKVYKSEKQEESEPGVLILSAELPAHPTAKCITFTLQQKSRESPWNEPVEIFFEETADTTAGKAIRGLPWSPEQNEANLIISEGENIIKECHLEFFCESGNVLLRASEETNENSSCQEPDNESAESSITFQACRNEDECREKIYRLIVNEFGDKNKAMDKILESLSPSSRHRESEKQCKEMADSMSEKIMKHLRLDNKIPEFQEKLKCLICHNCPATFPRNGQRLVPEMEKIPTENECESPATTTSY